MANTCIHFKEFVEYFLDDNKEEAEKYIKYADGSEYDSPECFITVYYKYDDTKNDEKVNLLWRVDEEAKWRRVRYGGSSRWALWWCHNSNDDE